MKQKLFIISVCVFVSSMHAYIFKLDVLRKWDRTHRKYQHVVLFGDFHDKTQSINATHRQYIKDVVRRNKKESIAILEDLSSTNQHNISHCNGILINSRGGVLGGLANDLFIDGVDVCNVEYRYCRVAALCPLINTQTSHMCACTDAITIQHIYTEVLQEIERIRNFRDSKELSVLYKKIVRQVILEMQKYAFEKYMDNSVASFCNTQSTSTSMSEFFTRLCVFDTKLLDMNILHQVVAAQVPYVFVAAGGTHTGNVAAYLASYGYESIYTSDCCPEQGTAQAIHISVENADTKKLPPAIDVRVVDKFVK